MGDERHPLHREVGWMLAGAWRAFWIGVTIYWPRAKRVSGRGYTVVPWHIWFVSAFIAAPAFAFEQAYLGWFWCDWGWPAWPGLAASKLHNAVAWWVEPRVTYMRWVPPQDPTRPDESGFWMEHEAAKWMMATGEWRTRIFLNPNPAVRGEEPNG